MQSTLHSDRSSDLPAPLGEALTDEANGGTCDNPGRMVAGALAHLAKHMQTGCPRASHLAVLLLVRVANDPSADSHLRAHASDMVDVLERHRHYDEVH